MFFLLKEKGVVIDSGFHFLFKFRVLLDQLIELLAVLVNVEQELIVGLGFDEIGQVLGNNQRRGLLLVLEHLLQLLLLFILRITCR